MEDDIKEIIEKISQKMAAKSTQVGIAEKLGVSQSYVSKILNGKRPVPKHRESEFKKLIIEMENV